jgi:hypothetical protein
MRSKLAKLKQYLTSGKLLTARTFAGEDPEVMLSLRDDVPFDAEWTRVEALLKRRPLSKADIALIDPIREAAFKAAFELTQNPELAGYVSDDFGLLAIAIATDFSDPWLNGLWSSYKTGTFPYKDVETAPGVLEI